MWTSILGPRRSKSRSRGDPTRWPGHALRRGRDIGEGGRVNVTRPSSASIRRPRPTGGSGTRCRPPRPAASTPPDRASGLHRAGGESRRRARAAGSIRSSRSRRSRPLGDGLHRDRQAVPGEPGGDQRVVVRPDRAVVIRHRVVAHFAGVDGPDAPAGKHALSQQRLGDLPRAVRLRETREQAMPGVRRADRAGTLLAIQRQRVGAESASDQNASSNRAAQGVRLIVSELGRSGVAARARKARPPPAAPRRRRPALRRAQSAPPRARHRRGTPNPANPSSLAESGPAAFDGVFDESVAIDVAVSIDPVQGALDVARR